MPTRIVAQPEMCYPLHFTTPHPVGSYAALPHSGLGVYRIFAIRPEAARRIYWMMVLIRTFVSVERFHENGGKRLRDLFLPVSLFCHVLRVNCGWGNQTRGY